MTSNFPNPISEQSPEIPFSDKSSTSASTNTTRSPSETAPAGAAVGEAPETQPAKEEWGTASAEVARGAAAGEAPETQPAKEEWGTASAEVARGATAGEAPETAPAGARESGGNCVRARARASREMSRAVTDALGHSSARVHAMQPLPVHKSNILVATPFPEL